MTEFSGQPVQPPGFTGSDFPPPPPSKVLLATIIGSGVLGVVFLILLILNLTNKPLSPADLDPSVIDPKLVIQIQVLNGNGVPKITDQVITFLRSQGFDVVDKGNYSSFNVSESVVIDRIGDKAAGRKLAEALGLPSTRVLTQVSWEYYADLTVVIGKDFKSLTPFISKK